MAKIIHISLDRPWWPVGLSCIVSNLSRDRCWGSRFKSPIWIKILIFQNWKQFLTIQTAGRQVTCVTYDICHGWVRTEPLACLVLSSIWKWIRVRVFYLEHWPYSIVYYQFKWMWRQELKYGRGYKPLIPVRSSPSHGSKTQMEGQNDEDTRKKGKIALTNSISL